MLTEFAIQIEKQEKDIYIKCLENNGEYPLPCPGSGRLC